MIFPNRTPWIFHIFLKQFTLGEMFESLQHWNMFNPCLPTLADESSFSFQRHCGKARINSLYCFLWEFIKSYQFMKLSSTCKTCQEIVGNHRVYPDFRADNIFAALIQNWKPATCPLPWLTTPGRMWIYSVWGSPCGLLLEKVGSMINHCTP